MNQEYANNVFLNVSYAPKNISMPNGTKYIDLIWVVSNLFCKEVFPTKFDNTFKRALYYSRKCK